MIVTQQCAFVFKKANCIAEYVKKNVGNGSREVILPFYFAFIRSHLQYCGRGLPESPVEGYKDDLWPEESP